MKGTIEFDNSVVPFFDNIERMRHKMHNGIYQLGFWSYLAGGFLE